MARRTAKGPSSPAWVRGYPRGALAVALLACFIGLIGPSAARSESAMLDLSRAVVVTPEALTGPEHKAVEILVEDVARRSGIRWSIHSAATSLATGPRPTLTTAGTFPAGNATSATWPSLAPTRSSSFPRGRTTPPKALCFPAHLWR
ncbi:MAG: hypothetical protein ABSH35_00815 [Isosphaeraceae bacterium]